MLKFQRNYRAEFEIGDIPNGAGRLDDYIPREKITISYPFTCQFDIEIGLFTSANRGVFQFINLSPADQASLWLDMYNRGTKYIYMKFYAGYGNNLVLCFEGAVSQCTSSKQGGSTEFVTQLEVYDGGAIFEYGFLNATFTEGTTLADIVKVATQDLKDIQPGYITPDILPLSRDRSYIGQPLNLLSQEYSGYNVFVQNGELNILGERDVLPGEVQVISDESGLLGSPRRGQAYVEWDMLFEPQLKVAQAVTLLSRTLSWMNQTYSIVKVHHKGIISPVVCGKLITTVTGSLATGVLREVKKETAPTYTSTGTSGEWLKPVKGMVSSPFGLRNAPIQGASKDHRGIDIAAPLNTPVTAPANGTVTGAYIKGGYGKYIEITHGKDENENLITSAYGHLNDWVVASGEKVSAGQQIGLVGSTGISTGPHLHFEVRKNGTAVNPTLYIGNY